MAELVHEWNVWETQAMVFLSFMLQLFLLATGSLRRRKINGVLKASIWLAYIGADFVAIYALGLFSQYEDKYNLGRESFGDALPFLWVPFLLVHLGGQDSITAFSIEDNNLWLRHLLSLATQAVLALYVFWKSFHRISYSILVPAMLVFLSGIIKYGERVWALKSASLNGLAESVKRKLPPGQNILDEQFAYSKESYALQIVLLARGFFAGRTVFQLGLSNNKNIFQRCFERYGGEGDQKLEMLAMELGMMFDLLYTKANVLQRWTGVLFRCASQTVMVVAFLLFLTSEKGAHNHNSINVVITYTLFTGAMFMEVCSIAVVMASPWTRAHLKQGSCLHRLCNFPTSFSNKAIHHYCNKSMHQTSIGQFNLMDYCIAVTSKPRILSKTISGIGLDRQWRNLWYVHHIDDSCRAGKGIISSVMEIISSVMEILGTGRASFRPRYLGRRLTHILDLQFETALYALQIYTDLHITRHFAQPDTDETLRLKEECETLSNYMMYLMMVHPSMLPVSTASAENLESDLLKWVRINNQREAATKLDILNHYTTSEEFEKHMHVGDTHCSPFNEPNGLEHSRSNPEPNGLEQSLMEIKKMWLRLLVYAAGKCRGELHARQLSQGGELITFVWLFMLHHGLGDVSGVELRLNEPDGGSVASRKHFFYAFNFRDDLE